MISIYCGEIQEEEKPLQLDLDVSVSTPGSEKELIQKKIAL
jgi:hypothetical protein